jgi:hypothetical protein
MKMLTNKVLVKIDGSNQILIQADCDNQYGFSLYDDDQTFPGGFGVGGNITWSVIDEKDPDYQALPERYKEWLQWELSNTDEENEQ